MKKLLLLVALCGVANMWAENTAQKVASDTDASKAPVVQKKVKSNPKGAVGTTSTTNTPKRKS